jgi:hypothetical protein
MTARPADRKVYCCIGTESDIPLKLSKEITDLKEDRTHVSTLGAFGFRQEVVFDVPRWLEMAPRARPLVIDLDRTDPQFNPLKLYISTKPFAVLHPPVLTIPEPTTLGTVLPFLKPSECERLRRRMPRRYLEGLAEAVKET